jgi:hypothetical protein
VNAVDDATWTRLQQDLDAGYGRLSGIIEQHAGNGAEARDGAIAAVTHLAYHVGAIRQKITTLRAH